MVLYANIDQTLLNKSHGPMHYKIGTLNNIPNRQTILKYTSSVAFTLVQNT